MATNQTLKSEQIQILNAFYANDARKLHRMVDRILSKFGGICDLDKDDFYSVANMVMNSVITTYDGIQNIDKYVYSCLDNRIKTEMTKRNRIKRKSDRQSVSADIPVGEDDNCTILDMIPSDFELENELPELFGSEVGEKVNNYLSSLSDIQKKIARLKMEGFSPKEIQKHLNITGIQYNRLFGQMRSYEKRKLLIRDTEGSGKGMEMEENIVISSEKTKNTSFAISALSKKLKKHQLRDDHILQRSSGQWNLLYKSELISDILQGKSLTQIIISEEIKNNITMHWLIDGKQRLTNIEDFLNDGYSISKKVQRYNIQYQAEKKDKNGKVVLSEDGFPIPENCVFDIRGKKFSQLPEELKDRILEYQIPVMLNLNCTKSEIAYDISRFNRCRPMNVAQNGWTGLVEEYAEFVDNILKMKFFQEDSQVSSFRESNNRSGMMRRMIIESIMVINYPDSFSKEFRKMCDYLSENADESVFIRFYSMIDRLESVARESNASMFNIKDSFIWFGLFARFIKLGMEDKRYMDFMEEFDTTLHLKVIDGKSYDDLNSKSTKDKNIVNSKLDHLEKLMCEYLDIHTETFYGLAEKVAV